MTRRRYEHIATITTRGDERPKTERDLLFDFKDIHKNLPLFGLVSDAGILEMPDASQLQIGAGVAALVQGTPLGAHLEGTSHETKLSTLTEEIPSSRP